MPVSPVVRVVWAERCRLRCDAGEGDDAHGGCRFLFFFGGERSSAARGGGDGSVIFLVPVLAESIPGISPVVLFAVGTEVVAAGGSGEGDISGPRPPVVRGTRFGAGDRPGFAPLFPVPRECITAGCDDGVVLVEECDLFSEVTVQVLPSGNILAVRRRLSRSRRTVELGLPQRRLAGISGGFEIGPCSRSE